MKNSLVVNLMRASVAAALAKARAVKPVQHAGLKGQFREIFINDLLTPLLPMGMAIGSGLVIDSKGGQSRQCDLIVYSKASMPSMLMAPGTGLFPIEACRYVIEVKSKLSASELEKAIENARSVKEMSAMSKPGIGLVTGVFAFESTLGKGNKSTKSELDRYLEKDPIDVWTDIPAMGFLCIAGNGYWSYGTDKLENNGTHGKWLQFPANEYNDEVVDFLGGFANTIINSPPPSMFGNYMTRGQTVEDPYIGQDILLADYHLVLNALNSIQNSDELSSKQIAKGIGWSASKTDNILEHLIIYGYVRKREHTNVYQITSAGIKALENFS